MSALRVDVTCAARADLGYNCGSAFAAKGAL
jgi:hypothetical protein